ncbi:hypothetical protein [Shewanella sp. YIC-542]|uniref:hypothetical protein n=1 Tax=Shewanella mytili TaxID=3377111 RepID=UPI00398E73FB
MAVGIKGLLRASILLFSPITLGWSLPAAAVPVNIPPLMTAGEMLTQLNQRLVHSKNSAATLHYWCQQQLNGADDLQIVQESTRPQTPPADIYQKLQIPEQTPLRYLKQRFIHQGKVIAVFDYWYRPDMLTAKMQQALAEQHTALVSIARQADFYRLSLGNTPRWPEQGAMPPFVLEHEAVIYRSDSKPFSLIQEHYSQQLLPRAQQLNPY